MADASGSKYSGGGAPPPVAATKPSVASKPAFTPTQSSGAGSFNPLSASRGRASGPKDPHVDEDGWGHDAPPVTRTQLEKVQPAYQPTKVNFKDLTSQTQPSPRFDASAGGGNADTPGVVKGAYQPVGKVDIAAIRRQAQESGSASNDRPGIVKGSYEPVGKVDIAAIRAKAQKPSEPPRPSASDITSAATGGSFEGDEGGAPVSDRASTFANSERLTSLPKPKVSSRFGGGSTFTGTKAPAPGGFESKAAPAAAPVGTASRTFADQGGKTPAQIWAEKKARERGTSGSNENMGLGGPRSPVQAQTSGGGEWKSGYAGKSWATVQTSHTGKSAGSGGGGQQLTGDQDDDETEQAAPQSPSGGISSIRDRFSGAPPMGAPAPGSDRSAPEPPPLDTASKPNAGRGIPLPALSNQATENFEDSPITSPPPQPPRSPTPPTPEMRDTSPIRVAMPVGRGAVGEVADAREEQMSPPPAMPMQSLHEAVPDEDELDESTGHDPARAASQATAAASFGHAATESANPGAHAAGKKALVQYDYEKAEDNEIELKEGEYVTNIEMVDEDCMYKTQKEQLEEA